MSFWIADTLRAHREQRGILIPDLARALRVSERTITRLEQGDTMGSKIDWYVAAYAYLVGLNDPRILWLRAAEAFKNRGIPPQFEPIEGPAAAFAQAIREAALRQTRGASAPSRKRASTPSRRVAG